MSAIFSGKNAVFKLTLPKEATLPNILTLLLKSLWAGPTSVKSLGILFILSLYNTIWDVWSNSFSLSSANG